MIGKLVGSAGFLSSGGTIGGDLTISGDLTVSGSTTNTYDEQIQGLHHVYLNDTSAYQSLIEQDSTGDAALQFLLTGVRGWMIGIDNSDSDKFKISTDVNDINDNNAITIDTSGNVGIGTDAPGASLHIERDLNDATADDLGDWDNHHLVIVGGSSTNDTASILLTTTADTYGGSAIVSRDVANYQSELSFWTKQSDSAAPPTRVMTLDSSGSVGIGQSSPDGKVHIESGSAGTIGTLSYADDLIIENSGGVGISIRFPDANSGNIMFQSATNDTVARIHATYGSGSEYLSFEVDGSERMRVNSAGNVGIGQDTPASLLNIKTAINTTLPTTISSTYHVAPYSHELFIENVANNETTSFAGIAFSAGTQSSGSHSFARIAAVKDGAVANASNLVFMTKTQAGVLNENMRINPSGRVKMHYGAHVKGKASFVLTGSINVTGTNVNVPGTSTKYLSELAIGDDIVVSGETRTIASISDDTTATVTSAWGSDLANDASPECNPAAFTVIRDTGAIGMVLDDGGNVGIGAAPSTTLHLTNTANDATAPELRLQNTRATGAGSDGDDAGTISFYAQDAGSNAEAMSTILSEVNLNTTGSTAGKLTFKTMHQNSSTALLTLSGWAGGSHSSTVSSAVFNTSFVGIGTASPLNVVQINHSGADGDNGLMIINEATTIASGALLGGVGFDSADGNVPSSVLEASSAIIGYASQAHSATEKGGFLTFNTTDYNSDDDTANVERMRIDSNFRLWLSNEPSGNTGNTIIGNQAWNHFGVSTDNDGSDYNTIIGHQAAGQGTLDAAAGNTAVGYQALTALTTGDSNVAIGKSSLDELLTGGYNVAVGVNTLHSADGAESENIAIGISAGSLIDNDSSAHNVLMGTSTGAGGSGAMIGCIAIGSNAMDATAGNAQTGTVAIGQNALTALTSGAGNIAIGYQASNAMDEGEYNTVIGYEAYTNATPTDTNGRNVIIGYQAGKFISTGYSNTIVGYSAGYSVDGTELTGDGNTCIGQGAGVALQGDANYNTLIGMTSGNAITTGDYNTCIGHGTDCAVTSDNQIAIGKGAVTDAANRGRWGNSSVSQNNIQTDWTVDSDIRIKKNIEDSDIGLSFINALKTRKYKKKHPSEYDAEILEARYKQGGSDYDDDKDEIIKDEFDDNKVWNGLVAQEVKVVMDDIGVEFSGWSEDTKGKQGIQYSTLVVPLIKAVQELSAKVEALENK